MRKNGDPVVVWNGFMTMLNEIGVAIKTMDETPNKITLLTDEEKCDCLISVFLRNNNNSKFQNQGSINPKHGRL